MNCTDIRGLLPAFLHGDLSPDETGTVKAHLAHCPACARDHTALQQVCRLLDNTPVPAVSVDLASLYRQAAFSQVRTTRRWRRLAAVVLLAAAALLFVTFALQGELRVEPHQVAFQWGTPPSPPPPPPPSPPAEPLPPPPLTSSTEDLEQQLRLLSDLIQAMAADADYRDARRVQELAVLRGQMDSLQRQLVHLRMATEQDLKVLYTAQFTPSPKGAIP